jgi:iron complex outermembrane receptor protein
MHVRLTRAAVAVAAATAAATVQAQSAKPAAELPPVLVTSNPLGSELFSLVSPTSVLGGSELFLQRRSTLGETLADLPGVSATYFGPHSSRPVIRGFDGDRIRILHNGGAVLDASALSFDHAVAVDPLAIERAEVVRGPAALLYGGSAVGGVVNVIDNRIPQQAVRGAGGRAEARFGGAEREKAAAGALEIGNGRFSLHADVYTRDTDDLKIKGPNVSLRQQAADPALAVVNGTLPNSASTSSGGAIGGSFVWDKGYLGLSYSGFDSRYGTVAEPDVTIDMDSRRWDVAGEARDLGRAITGLRFRLGNTDYKHTELDAGVPATEFRNKGYDLRLEALHGAIGPLHGAIGVQVTEFDFSALGAEAFVPSTHTGTRAAFVYEELPLGRLKLSFGARHERSEVRTSGGGPPDPGTGLPRFDPAQSRAFNGNSGALGGVYRFTPGVALAVNGAYTERAPTFYELYANGPHAATGAYEVGNAGFGKEKTRSLDAALRLRSGPHAGSIGVFASRASHFIALFNSGNTRGADGELNPVDADADNIADGSGEEILPEQVYRAVSARFRGWEAEGRLRLLERGGTLDLLLRYDAVRAEDRSTGRPLPRIAPRRFGTGLAYQRERFGARLDATRVEGQGRVAANELPTDGYTMLNAALTYRVSVPGANLEAFLRGVNLLDEEARNHVSFLKDRAPLGRRSAQIGLRGRF